MTKWSEIFVAILYIRPALSFSGNGFFVLLGTILEGALELLFHSHSAQLKIIQTKVN